MQNSFIYEFGSCRTHSERRTKVIFISKKRVTILYLVSSLTRNSQLIQCTSYFLNEMEWMLTQCDDIQGKLFCPKCNCKLGFWNWSGVQCSCGCVPTLNTGDNLILSAWCTPAFQIPISRVDEKKLVPDNPTTTAHPTILPDRAATEPTAMNDNPSTTDATTTDSNAAVTQ